MKGCVAEQKVSDCQMNAWILQTCDNVRLLSAWPQYKQIDDNSRSSAVSYLFDNILPSYYVTNLSLKL